MKRLAALAPLLLLSGAPVPDACGRLVALSGATLAVSAVRDGSFCHATMIARPRPGARIAIELWLPSPERWSGRYYQMGNGGFAGHIDGVTLAAAAARGDAAAATDTGHTGDGFDARWAAGRPDLVEDYAFRSIKVTADAARRVVGAYYRRPARRRYFMGCSYGGRQALVAASRWPADWDGIIAGAPALRWPERLAGFARIQRALRAAGAAVAPERLPPLIAAARARCGIGSAAGCGTRAAEIACRTGERATCLTAPQRAALATIEAAGYPLAEADPDGWRQWMLDADPTTGSQRALVDQAARYMTDGRDGSAGATGAEPFRLPAATQALFRVGSLATFERRGGRIVSYFGLADPVLPPGFARSDARSVGGRDAAYRLFLIAGMGHCQGGPLAPRFGQSRDAPALADDPEHDVRRAIERWVEQRRAPGTIVVGQRSGAAVKVGATPLH